MRQPRWWAAANGSDSPDQQRHRFSSQARCGRGAIAMTGFTHFDEQGKARMVDVSGKEATERVATARGRVRLQPETLALIEQGQVAKGDVLSVARLAGIMGAKRTPDLIPLCHPLALSAVSVDLTLDR